MPPEEATIHESLSAAWDAAETPENDHGTSEQDSIPEPAVEPVADEPEATDTGDSPPPDSEPVPKRGATPEAKQAPEKHTDAAVDQAPKGLPPEAREAWKDTPQPIRDAIAKREADFSQGIKQYASHAQRAQAMDKALAPFQQFFAMNGNNVPETMTGILQTAAVLQMGSPAQKAQTLANMIKQFGVDIPALDGMLSGEGVPPEMQQNSQITQLLDQRLAPLQQKLQQYEQREQQQAQEFQQGVAGEVQKFASDPKHEFYADVRMDMADIMDMAQKRGVTLSLKDAYDKACALHPEISKIVSARQSKQNVAQRRNAATSIHGAPGGEGGDDAPTSMRQALEQAWDNSGRM